MQYDSEYPSTNAGILCYDGVNIETFPSAPGGIPQWGGLPNSTIKDLEVKEKAGGYELWMSCLGRGIVVLDIITNPVGIAENTSFKTENYLTAYPNPASEKVEIGFNANEAGFVQLSIFDLNGRIVKEITAANLGAGPYTTEWDLTNESGKRVGAGIYFAKVINTGNVKTIKIIVQ
jgi:hypothetical protein